MLVNDTVVRRSGCDRSLTPWSCETVEKHGHHIHILNKPEQLRGLVSPHRKDGTQNEDAGFSEPSVVACVPLSTQGRLCVLDSQDSCFSCLGRAFLTEFGVEEGWPAPVKLPGHTEYEVQYSHLRQAIRWLGFQERYLSLPQFLAIKPDSKVLCTGAAYTIQRFCQAMNKPFIVRAYTEKELQQALGDMLPKLHGCHYHDVADPAWFSLLDFKVLLLEKPGGAPKASFSENKGYRWYSQK